MVSTNFDCAACLESKDEIPRWISNPGDTPICHACATQHFVPMFLSALEHELEYPPRWGPDIEIELANFGDLLPSGFPEAYQTKVQEYSTPVKNRIYCQSRVSLMRELKEKGANTAPTDSAAPGRLVAAERDDKFELCNEFLGQQLRVEQIQVATDDLDIASRTVNLPFRVGSHFVYRCSRCSSFTCTHCSTLLKMKSDYHTCPSPEVCRKALEKEFASLIRGKDYQVCPQEDCEVKAGLMDGCNQVSCAACRTQYCFICGQAARHDSKHWARGNPCPRWNQPGSTNAQHDDENGNQLQGGFRIDEETLERLQSWVTDPAKEQLKRDITNVEFLANKIRRLRLDSEEPIPDILRLLRRLLDRLGPALYVEAHLGLHPPELLVRSRACYTDFTPMVGNLWTQIPEAFRLQYPRLYDTVERFLRNSRECLAKIDDLLRTNSIQAQERAPDGVVFDFVPLTELRDRIVLNLPDIGSTHQDMQETQTLVESLRLSMIEHGRERPEWLAAVLEVTHLVKTIVSLLPVLAQTEDEERLRVLMLRDIYDPLREIDIHAAKLPEQVFMIYPRLRKAIATWSEIVAAFTGVVPNEDIALGRRRWLWAAGDRMLEDSF